MRIKLDENIPNELAAVLGKMGHDVDTVQDEGMTGASDARVWSSVRATGRFLVTQDLDFSDLRQFAPGTHPGIRLVRLRHPSRRQVLARIESLFKSGDLDACEKCFAVATESKLRMRRP